MKGFQLGGILHQNTEAHKMTTGKQKRGCKSTKTVLNIFVSRLEKLGCASYIPYLRQYFAEITQLMENYGSLFLNRKSKVMSGDLWKETLMTASNMVTNRASGIANHTYKPSCLPALVTCHNPVPSHPFTGGNFLLSGCGLHLKYGLGDMILVNGARQHGVLPATSNGKGCIRHSMVYFSQDGPHNEHLC
jgi:hypothetical protein